MCAGAYEGMGEHALSTEYLPPLAEALAEYGHTVYMTNRIRGGGSFPRHAAHAANKTNAELAIEFHFNSSHPQVMGGEVFYWGKSVTGKRFAAALSARMCSILGVTDRGAKPVTTIKDRAFMAFKCSRMPFFIVEPCFAGSNKAEAETFSESIESGRWMKEMAQAIHETVQAVYGEEA